MRPMTEDPFAAADIGRAAASYREIKSRIMDRRFAPGEKLSEVRLAAELGVGRSPIRTALARLQGEGWIAVSPQSGTYVKGLTDAEMNEVFELRLILEPAVAGLAAERMSQEELARLRRAFEAFGTEIALGQVEEYFALDLQTHRAIYSAAGNGLINGILVNLLDKVHWIQRTSVGSPRPTSALGEIRDLLAALESRDAARAADVMRTHILRTAKFRNLPAGTPEAEAETPAPAKEKAEPARRRARAAG
ncbi:GntR family transcriptional regulator [Roseixanthobacter glucoisosaccharinicivorans]|uniref:GntR family transcriptional regulator n=1 Tax=Roseixanthobacter glucoisosaccharinicivorans TaxID=3119923 RepID=UPI0037275B10